MKKISVILFILGAALTALIGGYFYYGSKARENNDNILFVGTNADFPPFEYRKNGAITGFDIELINAVAAYLGKHIVLKDMAFDSLLIEAQSGRIQVVAAAMTATPERCKKVFFTDPHLAHDPLVAVTLASKSPKSLEDLYGKEVIVNDGYTAERYMKQFQNNIMLRSLSTPAEAFLALKNGRGYAYVSARSAVQPFFDQCNQGMFNILVLPASETYAFVVSKEYPKLFEQIKEALVALEHNGTIEQLKKKWHLNF